MKNSIDNKKTNVWLLLYGVAIFFIQFSIFGEMIPHIGEIKALMRYISFGILGIIIIAKMLERKFSIKEIVAIAMLIVLGAISAVCVDSYVMLELMLFTIAAKDNKVKEIIRVDFAIKTIIALIIISLYLLGITKYYNYGERATLGFGHPNLLGYILALIMFDYCYLKYNHDKKTLIKCVAFSMACILIMTLSGSRTAMMMSVLYIIVLIVSHFLKRKSIKKLVILMPIGLLVLSILLTFNYLRHGQMYQEIDQALSGRTRLQSIYYKKYNVTFFGNNISEYRSEIYLDNAYYRYLYNFGIYGIVVLLYIYMYIIRKNNSDERLMATIGVLLIYGVSEFHALRPELSPFGNISLCEDKNETK